MTLILVRHAHAGERSAWTGDDRVRPLSARGNAQAHSIADLLADRSPSTLIASPALRCVQTLEPLARANGLTVDADDRLFEGSSRADVVDFLHWSKDRDVVACSHGDVIPDLLRVLLDAGMKTRDPLRWQKASTWIIERRHDSWTKGSYVAPPDRDPDR